MRPTGKHFNTNAHDSDTAKHAPFLTRNAAAYGIGSLFALIRVALAANTPIVPLMDQQYDDLLLVRYANSIMSGDWLGTYGQNTLAKNPGYSLILQLPSMLHISYQLLYVLLLVLGSYLFVRAIRPLVPSLWVRLAVFVAMLFIPPLMTYEMFQRMYRMGITIPFVIVLFSSYIAVYLRRNEPPLTIAPWCVGAALSMAGLYYVKEDSMWILPFVGVVSLILVVVWVVGMAKRRVKVPSGILCIALLALPLGLTAALGHAIKAQNQTSYGVYTTCERTDSGFSNFVSKLISIDAGDSNPDVWITDKAYDMAFRNSPTFASIQKEVQQSLNNWGGGQPVVYGDLAFWSLRDAYAAAGGYTDGAKSNEFWQNAANELDSAFQQGILSKKPGLSISSIVPPIGANDVPRLAHRCFANAKMLLSLSRTTVFTDPGGGEMEDQLVAAKLINGPITLSDATYPLPMPQRISLKANTIILMIERFLAWPVAIIAAISIVALAVVSFAKGYINGRHALLIILGLLLSCVVIIVAVSWDILYLETGEIVEWASYMYCSSCYPLFAMAGTLAIGSLVTYIMEHMSLNKG